MDNSLSSMPPIDLRHLAEINENIVSGIAIFINLVLILLIFTRTPPRYNGYRIILLQTCAIDLLYILVNLGAKTLIEYKDGTMFAYLNGPLSNVSPKFTYWTVILWVCCYSYCVTSIPVQFIYRYRMIHGKKLNLIEYFGLLLASTIAALIYGLANVFTFDPNGREEYLIEKAELLRADYYYYQGIPSFIAADINGWPMRFTFFYAYFINTGSYGITIYTTIKIMKTLKSKETHFSPQTKKMHRQINVIMALQALSPLIFMLSPFVLIITIAFAKLNYQGFGFYITFVWCWLPIVNAMITICGITSYRQTFSQCFKNIYGRRMLITHTSNISRAIT